MPFISVTRLRVRSAWYLPKFLWHAIPSSAQARKAPGNLGVDLLNDAKFAFWTRSAWNDEASMRAYMLAGAHRKAMPALMDMCDEACTAHWEQEGSALPGWTDVHKRLQESGRASKVRHPSPDHEARRIAPPRGQ
jgi:quinol monooxygenase YgiN